jgi:hypothetical protein
MEIKGSWSSENKPSNHVENMDFSSLVGVWNAGVKIYITNPYTYSKGCITKSDISKTITIR